MVLKNTIKEPEPPVPSVTTKQQEDMTEEQRTKAVQDLMKQLGIDTDEEWSLDQELRFETYTIKW